MWYDGVCTVWCSSRHSPPLQNLYIRSAWAFDIKHIQGWKFALSLKIAHFKERPGCDSLSIIFTKEQPWANRSHRSLQKSQVSESLLSLFKKKRCECFAHHWIESLAKNERFPWKTRMYLTVFPLFMPKSESLPLLFSHSLFFKEPHEWFALVALFSLFCSQKNWRFAGKTKERIPNTEYIHIYTVHTHPHTHTHTHTPTHTHTHPPTHTHSIHHKAFKKGPESLQ